MASSLLAPAPACVAAAAAAASLLAAAGHAARRAPGLVARRAARNTTKKPEKPSGGLPRPLQRAFKRRQKDKQDERFGRFKLDADRPPPPGASGGPVSGAWKDGRPESESLRQGEFTSPYTGQVYDRWAPIGLKQNGTDRQGGLGRSRAYETPMQRKIRTALTPTHEPKVEEWEKYYPGTAPPMMMPKPKLRREKKLKRHGLKAGSFEDIWKQICIQAVIDCKIQKSEKAIWYVETCAGEGEYHISRLQDPGHDELHLNVRFPRFEDVYEVLRNQDLSFHPTEIQGFMEGMKLLNDSEDLKNFEEKGDKVDKVEGEVKWLSSTTLVACQRLREQDVVTLWEDNPIAFAALNNFMRNWSGKFKPKLELQHKNGFVEYDWKFGQKKKGTKAHGQIGDRRGVVFADADWVRGGDRFQIVDMIQKLNRHWKAATVIATYPLNEDKEADVKRWLKDLRQADGKLDLLIAEFTVDTPEWLRDMVPSAWYGQGIIISNPPGLAGQRIRDAGASLCEELSQHEDASPMRMKIQSLKYQQPSVKQRRAARDW